jgi:hypothetical protein
MLEFVNAVDALPKIQKLEDTFSCMMKQIYECALFIREYGERGFFRGYPGIRLEAQQS